MKPVTRSMSKSQRHIARVASGESPMASITSSGMSWFRWPNAAPKR